MNTFIKSILIPFIISRALLLVVGYLSPQYVPIQQDVNQSVKERGWLISQHRYIDVWARWDSGWYLNIAKDGYMMGKDVYTMSNLAFYPTYPFSVRAISMTLPKNARTDEVLTIIGIVFSNSVLLLALYVLYHLTHKLFHDKKTAQLAVWLLLLFPTSFFLSSFYTESLFLCVTVLSFWFAYNRQWFWAVLCASIATATRPVGIAIAIPLFLTYAQSKQWNLKKFDRHFWLLGLIPSGIALFFGYMHLITGDFLAAVKVQSAWGRHLADPFQSLIAPTGFWPYLTPFDQLTVVFSLITGLLFLKSESKKNNSALGTYVLLLTIPLLLTGTLDSASRYAVVAFPLFQYWASSLLKRKALMYVVLAVFLCLQLIYFALFSQFHWVG